MTVINKILGYGFGIVGGFIGGIALLAMLIYGFDMETTTILIAGGVMIMIAQKFLEVKA